MIGFQHQNVAQEMYLAALSSHWNQEAIREHSVWLSRDPMAEEKMLVDPVIGHAIGQRCSQTAGRAWSVVAESSADPLGRMAAEVGKKSLGKLLNFTGARKLLARSFFHGGRRGRITLGDRVLALGDGVPRMWRVPIGIEDQDKFRYRKKIHRERLEVTAHWQRYELVGDLQHQWINVSDAEANLLIDHVHGDEESTLGYGRALREAMGWHWFALRHTNNEALKAVDRYARGLTVARIDGLKDGESGKPNMETARTWLKMLAKAREGTELVLDKRDEVEVLTGGMEGYQIILEFRREIKAELMTLILSANLPHRCERGR